MCRPGGHGSCVQRTRQCPSSAPRQTWAVPGCHGMAVSSQGWACRLVGRSGGIQPHLRWGLVPTSIFANLSWRPLRPCFLSVGDLKHFGVRGYPSSPHLPIPPSVPVLRCSPGPQRRWQQGCAVPGGCGSPVGSIGGPSHQQVPSQVPTAAGGCGSGKGLTFQGQAAAGKPSLGDCVTSTWITMTSEI